MSSLYLFITTHTNGPSPFRVKAKLLELGHLAKDMGGLTTLSAVNKDTELTDLSKFLQHS